MSRWARAWGPVLVWCAVVFGLSSIPGSAIPVVAFPHLDKVVHVALYLVLGALGARALRRSTSWGRGRIVALATFLAAAYGVTDELHQLWTPHRSCDAFDALADAVGGLAGAWLATSIRRRGKSEAAL